MHKTNQMRKKRTIKKNVDAFLSLQRECYKRPASVNVFFCTSIFFFGKFSSLFQLSVVLFLKMMSTRQKKTGETKTDERTFLKKIHSCVYFWLQI